MKYLLYIALLMIGKETLAQVESGHALQMNGPSSKRNVTGLGSPDDLQNAVNANSVQSGYLLNAQIINFQNDTLYAQLPLGVNQYVAGMELRMQGIDTTRGITFLSLNGLPPKEIRKNARSLDSGMITFQLPILLIYSGSYFEMVSETARPCKKGFIPVNTFYCIESNEHDSVNVYNAMDACGSLGGKLCTWSQWYIACQQSSPQLLNMIGNYEWVDDAGNYGSPYVQAKAMGGSGCDDNVSVNPTGARAFRCCHRR